MDIKLDTETGTTLPSDLFLSVKIGDVQKQSRLAESRTYRFSQDTDAAFGRVEVFRRVGAATIPLNMGTDHDVWVPCNHPQLQDLQLHMAVQRKSQAPPREQSLRQRQKFGEAQQYLAKYNLEDLIADAVREVIQARPENPHRFIAERLLEEELVAPPCKDAEPNVSPPMAPQAASFEPAEEDCIPDFRSIETSCWASIYSLFPQQPRVRAAPQQAGLVQASSFRSLPSESWAKIHEAFPSSSAAKSSGTSKAPHVPVAGIPDFRSMPMQQWALLHEAFGQGAPPATSSAASKPSQAPPLGEGVPDFRTVPAEYWARLHQSFPQTAAVGSSSPPRAQESSAAQLEGGLADFRSMPLTQWASIHSKFPLASAVTTSRALPVEEGVQEDPRPQSIGGGDFRTAPPELWASLHGKFEALEAPAQSATAIPEARPGAADYRSAPVGFWEGLYGRFPKPVVPKMEVTVVLAKNLRDADWFGKSDPYCICQVIGRPDMRFRTEVMSETLNPVWNHQGVFHNVSAHDVLEFIVMDDDTAEDDPLGRVTLSGHQIIEDNGFDGDLQFRSAASTLQLRITL
mmetsp:Transcript_72520/g.172918  ORF Transcript_72520/g.172918 Transcript_72520/m.172918 type:complete len:572 (+) Transcript_72520:54-1769(+)